MCKRAVDLTYGLRTVQASRLDNCKAYKPNQIRMEIVSHAGLGLPAAHYKLPTHLAHDLPGI